MGLASSAKGPYHFDKLLNKLSLLNSLHSGLDYMLEFLVSISHVLVWFKLSLSVFALTFPPPCSFNVICGDGDIGGHLWYCVLISNLPSSMVTQAGSCT